ncbi:ligand-binding sensor domain-containing protein [Flexithrix dorotheae]|uniref:ligand-binding sensor domain-containing protein n=1 Tax=Flexithrix dorotheae TaxID=70993 RepID=UPI000379CCCD|nr:two-component regulator propeller domain-containing protein [Flexithrix dorotheae]
MLKALKFIITFLLFYQFGCTNNTVKKEELSDTANGPYRDTSFQQEYHQGFVIKEDNAETNDVRSVQPDKKGNIWIATKGGVFQKKKGEEKWELMISGENHGPAYDVMLDKNGKIWAGTWNGIYSFQSGEMVNEKEPEPPISNVTEISGMVYAFGPRGIWAYQQEKWEKKDYPVAKSIREVLPAKNGGFWLGTDVGLYLCKDDKTKVFQDRADLVSAYVTGIAYSDDGNLWVGSLGGVAIRNEKEKIAIKLPENGIPNGNVTVVKKAPDGKMWVGTDYGISRFTPGKAEYSVRLSRRWLMSNEVRDINFDDAGNAWIATSKGVSVIMKKEMTLEEKANYFYQQLITRHVRDPWIVGRFRLEVPGDTTTLVPEDDDNDGEYTSMYLAMESFRYAVTGNPQAKERAKKSFDFLYYLREVTGNNGFFARTIIPVSWERSHDMNRTYTPQELAEELVKNPRHKPVEKRWHLSEDGKWKWKGDTSSDELCGHFFGYYCYYNFAADEAEKKRIASHVDKIMDHLLQNNFNLIGVDGTPTKWGVWSPKILNHDPDWAQERALNSLEILSFLKFVYHITGKEVYQDAYINLIENEGYLENARKLFTKNPAWETYFDIYLALYVYPPLIKYEDNPALKSIYEEHLDEWFNKYKNTNSPLLNFTYNYLNGGQDGLESSLFFLKDAPLDLVDWEIDNGSREDLNIVRKPILEELQVDELRPPSEYRTMRWDRNPYQIVAGNPAQERDPVYWLLPYWMGRYLNLIENSQ